jgi:hypothetical protein
MNKKTEITDLLRPSDLQELQHIADGGRFCLDGRKVKRLVRLGLIFKPSHIYGYQVTSAGRSAIEDAIREIAK